MGKPRMQASGTERMTDASYHLEKKRLSPKRTTALVNRQGGFEGISILTTPQFLFRSCELQLVFAVAQDCENLLKMGSNSNRLFSHCFRKTKNQQLEFLLSC